jgi:hypothetical protein
LAMVIFSSCWCNHNFLPLSVSRRSCCQRLTPFFT